MILAGMPVALGLPAAPLALRAAALPVAGSEIRVLLLETDQVQVAPVAGALQLRDGSGRLLASLPDGQGGIVRLEAAAAALRFEGLGSGTLSTAPASLLGRELWLEAGSGTAARNPDQIPAAATTAVLPAAEALPAAALLLQGRPYRGRLQLRLENGRLQVINHLDLEAYLASVVGSEMPASWPQQALRAQAVAARTYALKERRPAEPFDLRATVASQVYRGIEAETPSTREAVAATRHQVLTYGDDLIQAVFHSSSGVATEDSGAVWSRQLPYLVSVPDFDRSSPVSAWTLRFTAAQLSQLFPETGGVSRFEVLAVSGSGRLRQVRVQGPRGQRLYSGAELRRILGLRSTLVQFEPLPATAVLPAAVALSPQTAPSASVPPSAPATVMETAASPSASTSAATTSASETSGSQSASSAVLPPLPPIPASGLTLAPAPQPPIGWLLKGRGFGHGVGMSQWGAFGLASQGFDYARILQHYYRGTSLITLPEPLQTVAVRRGDLASGTTAAGVTP